MSHVDFSWPPFLTAALLSAAMQPVYLLFLTRLPRLGGRNALQFMICAVMVLVTFGALASRSTGGSGSELLFHFAVAVMALASGLMLGLEVWGLLSRGYTIAILLTLLDAAGPMNERDIINAYRKGEGLDWIMRHRVAGLVSAGLVTRRQNDLVLTPICGTLGAQLARAFVIILGVRRTG